MSIEAMKQALEALEDAANILTSPMFGEAAATLRAAIKQAEKQEPFGWYDMEHGEIRDVEWTRQKPKYEGVWKPLYTTPPAAPVQVEHCIWARNGNTPCPHTAAQRQWVGLSDEEIDQGLLRSDYALQTAHAWRAGVVFAMTQLKEKNT